MHQISALSSKTVTESGNGITSIFTSSHVHVIVVPIHNALQFTSQLTQHLKHPPMIERSHRALNCMNS